MSVPDRVGLGAAIQAYRRARWNGDSDVHEFHDLDGCLDRNMRDRIDMLGLDGERLLSVAPADVLAELEALEREARREDAGSASAAAQVRAREEVSIGDQAKNTWRD